MQQEKSATQYHTKASKTALVMHTRRKGYHKSSSIIQYMNSHLSAGTGKRRQSINDEQNNRTIHPINVCTLHFAGRQKSRGGTTGHHQSIDSKD